MEGVVDEQKPNESNTEYVVTNQNPVDAGNFNEQDKSSKILKDQNDVIETNRRVSEDFRSINGDRLSMNSGINIDDLIGVKLLGVLGTDDLAGAKLLIQKYAIDDVTEKTKNFGSPLHLAVMVSSFSIVKSLVEEYSNCAVRWINAQDSNEQQTALHMASKNGNYDAVCLFLDIDGVDETIQDCEYRTASDLSLTKQLSLKFKSHKEHFVEELKAFVAANIQDKESAKNIIQRFSNDSRARDYLRLGWFDINSPLNNSTDHNILHLASKYENNDLVEWALSFGSDANVKDSRGRRAIDFAPKKNITIRQKLLTAAPMEHRFLSGNLAVGSMIDHTDNIDEKELPVLKDTLFKWTNYASGFRPRYFVIENGTLSYYKTISDYPNACKGSINLATCNFEINNRDSTRLEVYIAGKDKPHFSVQAKSHIYAKQWFWAMVQSKMILNARAKRGTAPHHSDVPKNSLIYPEASQQGATPSDNSSDSTAANFPGPDTPAFLFGNNKELQTFKMKLSLNLSTITNVVNMILEKFEAFSEENITPDKVSTYQSNLSPEIADTLKSIFQQLTSTIDGLLCLQSKRESDLVNFYKRKIQSIRVYEERLQKIISSVKESELSIDQDDAQMCQNIESTPKIHEELEQARISANKDFQLSVMSTEDNVSDDVFYNTECAADPLQPLSDYGSNLEETEISHEQQQDCNNIKTYTDSGASSCDNSTLETESTNTENKPDNPSVEFKNPFIPITDQDTQLSSLGYPTKEELRSCLPLDPKIPKPTLHIWSFIKSSIGKDLSRITVPVFFNEPLSTLQRLCEDVAYIELLTLASRVGSGSNTSPRITDFLAKSKAEALNLNYDDLLNLDEANSAALRSLFVSVFAISCYSSTERVAKPFNPLLGETFELCSKEKCYRYIAEQVSHHPPISASHCESPDYCMSTEAHMKSKFWGKTFEITPAGYTHLLLAIPRSEWPKSTCEDFGVEYNTIEDAKKYGLSPYEPEVYSWKKVSTYVTNFVFGKMKLENRGTLTVLNKNSRIVSTISFIKPKSGMGSWIPDWSNNTAKGKSTTDLTIKGTIALENGNCIWELSGNYFKHIYARPTPQYAHSLPPSLRNGFVVWEAEPYPPESKNNYNFTYTAISLNQLSPEHRFYLPHSDSRLRPDQRYMESGKWDEASAYKESLELYQRSNRASLVALYSQTKKPCQRPDYDMIYNSIHSENKADHIGESWWRPRWFINCYDPFTKENYWRFVGDYWNFRKALSVNSHEGEPEYRWPSWSLDLYSKKSVKSLCKYNASTE